jgi:hypothetical protein
LRALADRTSLNKEARAATSTLARLDFYGLGVSVAGWPRVVGNLELDFAWFARFQSEGAPDVEVVIERRQPDLDALGNPVASFVTPRNVVYQDGARTVVDYFGQAVSLLDRDGDRVVIQGEREDVVYQAAYLFLLSRVGRHLDARGLPRLHGLGIVGGQGGVVVMLPSGGGKTALALQTLRSSEVRLLSEDSPLIDRRGMVHPFPLRIGIHPAEAESLPDGELRRIERLELGAKMALEVDAFADRIATRPEPLRHIVIGRRSLGRGARLEAAPRAAALGPLLSEAVVGVGLYQGMEFVLRRGMRDVLRHSDTALRRALSCAGVLRRAKVWRLEAGRERERNWAALQPLL